MKTTMLVQIATLPLLCASELADINQSQGTTQTLILRTTQSGSLGSPFNLFPNAFVTQVQLRDRSGRHGGFRGGPHRSAARVGAFRGGPHHGRVWGGPRHGGRFHGGLHGRGHGRW